MKIKHPAIRYHGGKFRLAPWVISHFPQHRCYVEPFGGAASVLLQKSRSYAEVYNDLDGEIVNLFKVLRDAQQTKLLQEACALTPFSRDEFEAIKDPASDPLERARRTVALACMGFGTASACGGNSGFRCDSKREYTHAARLWAAYPAHLSAICQRLQGVFIENKDALQVMRTHDAADTLHYIDPPYLPDTRVTGNRYYRYEMTAAGHEQLLAVTRTLTGMVIISGYDSELYNDMLPGWRKCTKPSRISAGRGTKIRIECLWINPQACMSLEQ